MIIGFPNETMRQIRETVSVARELQFAWYPLQLLTPLPGTEITLNMIEQGLIQPPDPRETKFLGMAAGSKSKSGGAHVRGNPRPSRLGAVSCLKSA